jgi:hypothetical protein
MQVDFSSLLLLGITADLFIYRDISNVKQNLSSCVVAYAQVSITPQFNSDEVLFEI